MLRLRISPLTAALALGLACQIGQIVYLREFLMVFHGNELSIGLIFAAWMFWVGTGSRWGYRIVERTRDPLRLLVWNSFALFLFLPVTVPLIRSVRHWFGTLPGVYLSVLDMLAACMLLMVPVCLLLGMQFVLLARLWRERDGSADTSAAGKAYIAEAAGNILGGLVFTFVLVHAADAVQITFFAGVLLAGALLVSTGQRAGYGGTWIVTRLGLFFAIAAGCMLSLPLLRTVDRWADSLYWRAMAPGYALVATHDSKYGRIHVGRMEDQFSFFQSGHLVFTAGGGEKPGLEEAEAAVLAHFAMAQHPAPERVLLIGGGLRGTLREILRHPVEHVEYVELDEVLLTTARPFLAAETLRALDDPRVRVRHTDGRLFVKTTPEKYDVIIVDAPDPATAVLNRLYTREFFAEVSARLLAGGLFVHGAVSTADLRGRRVANRNATLYHTLRSVFPHVLPVGDRHLLFFAGREAGVFSWEAEVLRERFSARSIDPSVFSPRHFEILLEDGSLRRVNWILRNHGRSPRAHLEAPPAAPLFSPSVGEQAATEDALPPVYAPAFINSDFRPVGYYHTLVFWSVLARTDHAVLFDWIARARSWWIVPLVAAVLLCALAFRVLPAGARSLAPRFGVRLAVFTTGLSTMSLQIAMLFAFQAIHGFVYEMVGLIVAMFMAGLLCGTTLTQRKVTNKANIRLLAAVQGIIALFAAAIAAALTGAAALASPTAVFSLFFFLTFMAGFLNGLDFPLAAACCLAFNRRAEKSTGMVYGTELFGACAGATLASVLIVPVMGIAACCLFAAIVNATAFAVLMITRRETS